MQLAARIAVLLCHGLHSMGGSLEPFEGGLGVRGTAIPDLVGVHTEGQPLVRCASLRGTLRPACGYAQHSEGIGCTEDAPHSLLRGVADLHARSLLCVPGGPCAPQEAILAQEGARVRRPTPLELPEQRRCGLPYRRRQQLDGLRVVEKQRCTSLASGSDDQTLTHQDGHDCVATAEAVLTAQQVAVHALQVLAHQLREGAHVGATVQQLLGHLGLRVPPAMDALGYLRQQPLVKL
mmetsp:Transcript_136742/g.381116  ORF Transcript_136742/g.381116 Transcript_136742/m.381116 type:complete len:236 (-) Transcript_136742:541-1248(-)